MESQLVNSLTGHARTSRWHGTWGSFSMPQPVRPGKVAACKAAGAELMGSSPLFAQQGVVWADRLWPAWQRSTTSSPPCCSSAPVLQSKPTACLGRPVCQSMLCQPGAQFLGSPCPYRGITQSQQAASDVGSPHAHRHPVKSSSARVANLHRRPGHLTPFSFTRTCRGVQSLGHRHATGRRAPRPPQPAPQPFRPASAASWPAWAPRLGPGSRGTSWWDLLMASASAARA